jgi:hypothetical protein
MADDNLSGSPEPVNDAPPTEAELVEDISNLLEDPETDLPEDEADEAAAEPEQTEEEDDPLGLNDKAEDVDEDDADNPDESQNAEIKGGRFAPDSAKVTLDDGTVTTIAELKRGTLFQRDYTKKTQELSEDRKAIEAEREQVSQYAQSLNQFREMASWYAEKHLPKAPEPFDGDPATDPVGYLTWSQKRDEYLAHQQAFQAFQQQKAAEEQRMAGETQQQAKERAAKEQAALYEAMPILKDPVKGKLARETLLNGASEYYGFSEEEAKSFGDHRMILALRDAIAYRRIKAKAPQVQAEVKRKPVQSGRRENPRTVDSRGRKERSEQLRNSGSFEAGVAALSDFDL